MKRKFITKHGFLALGKHLVHFMRRLCVFAFFYGLYAACSYGIALAIPLFLQSSIGLNQNICLIIKKILLTVAPIVPSLVYLRCYEEDTNEEFSTDLCFIAWIATIVWAWAFL